MASLNYGQYIRISSFLRRMKYIHGADFVNSTLRRHYELKNALTEFEKNHILDLEREFLTKED